MENGLYVDTRTRRSYFSVPTFLFGIFESFLIGRNII